MHLPPRAPGHDRSNVSQNCLNSAQDGYCMALVLTVLEICRLKRMSATFSAFQQVPEGQAPLLTFFLPSADCWFQFNVRIRINYKLILYYTVPLTLLKSFHSWGRAAKRSPRNNQLRLICMRPTTFEWLRHFFTVYFKEGRSEDTLCKP